MSNTKSLILAALLSLFILLPLQAQQRSSLPLEEIKEFAKALELIQQNYVDETEESELMRDAIRGMLRDLDPYSVYLDQRQKESLQIRTQGKFGGLGIQVSYEENAVKVISPIDDTPASRAGIQSLDRIISIDGVSTSGLDLQQSVDLMRGRPGSTVDLEVQREGIEGVLSFQLKREVILIKSIVMRPFNDGYVYSRISNFQGESARDFISSLEEMKDEMQLKGLILDLRNNPGGLLTSAIDISDIFIKEGTIVSTEGRLANANSLTYANGRELLEGVPVVVLINGGSASASEIVAGALQDQERALIAGTTSFGKGTVQSVVPLSPNASLKLTTARYKTPSGKFINGIGIEPDVVVDFQDLQQEGMERELQAHRDKIVDGNFNIEMRGILENDVQLFEAYELLVDLSSSNLNTIKRRGS